MASTIADTILNNSRNIIPDIKYKLGLHYILLPFYRLRGAICDSQNINREKSLTRFCDFWCNCVISFPLAVNVGV